MPAAGALAGILPIQRPGPKADWLLSGDSAALQLTNISSGLNLSVTWWGGLHQSPWPNARWSIERADGCAVFPEVEVNVEGNPGIVAAGPRRSSWLSGRSRAYHRLRIPGRQIPLWKALEPVRRHGGAEGLPRPFPGWQKLAIAENLLSTGSLFGTHFDQGVAGLRRMAPVLLADSRGVPSGKASSAHGAQVCTCLVADLVKNRALCEILLAEAESLHRHGEPPAASTGSLRPAGLHRRAVQRSRQGVLPDREESRRSSRGHQRRQTCRGHGRRDVAAVRLPVPERCRTVPVLKDIDSGLQEMWDWGVQSMFPVHKFDNAFGGTTMDSGATGVLVDIGNFWMTGRWWEVEPCSTSESDHSPPGPSGPTCNVRGLTALGEDPVNRMIDKGMIVETDHLSVKGRARVLDILESRNYSGVITSHSWGDDTSRVRIQALGGVVSPYVKHGHHVHQRVAKRALDPVPILSLGNWLRHRHQRTRCAGISEESGNLTYPFTSFDGHATIHQSQWGNRLWDLNLDGASHYGLYADWTEDLRLVAGQEIIDDLARGAEAYLQMWERAVVK